MPIFDFLRNNGQKKFLVQPSYYCAQVKFFWREISRTSALFFKHLKMWKWMNISNFFFNKEQV